MAKQRFLVAEDSFIGMELIRAEQRKIVTIETDPEKGGMRPGKALIPVDDEGKPIEQDDAAAEAKAEGKAASDRAAKAAAKAAKDNAKTLAGNGGTGDLT
jgi:hypothetical protein